MISSERAVQGMGQSRKRVGRGGDVRYTAYYEDARGHRRSAGTFTSLKAANKAWQQAEAKVAEGRGGQSHRGRQLFERYVEDVWFPNHVMELTTRQNYTYSLNRHIMPTFAEFRMIDILPADVREWVAKLQVDGVPRLPPARPATIHGLRMPHRADARSLSRPKIGLATIDSSAPTLVTSASRPGAASIPTRSLTFNASDTNSGARNSREVPV
jgi:Phage integrase, N-terminal SAM-like domain